MAQPMVRGPFPLLSRSGYITTRSRRSPLRGTVIGKRSLRDSRLGGNSAFEQVIADHMRVVYRTAVRLAGRTYDAEDLAQDTFLRAWRSRHTFQPGTNAKAWLLRILHNMNIDRFRARRRMVPTVSELCGLGSAIPMSDTPESLVLAGLMEAEVFEALRGLPERFRTCLILADLHGRSHAEIAKGLGVPLGTVMSRLFRALLRPTVPLAVGLLSMALLACTSSRGGGPRPHHVDTASAHRGERAFDSLGRKPRVGSEKCRRLPRKGVAKLEEGAVPGVGLRQQDGVGQVLTEPV